MELTLEHGEPLPAGEHRDRSAARGEQHDPGPPHSCPAGDRRNRASLDPAHLAKLLDGRAHGQRCEAQPQARVDEDELWAHRFTEVNRSSGRSRDGRYCHSLV